MQIHTVTVTRLIQAIAKSFVDHPEQIQIGCQPAADGSCYFVMRGAPEDHGKLIGAHGSHVDAFKLIVEAFGCAVRQSYTFRLITAENRTERPKDAPRDVVQYDTLPDQTLLTAILAALRQPVTVSVGPGEGPRHSLTFAFTIRCGTADAYRVLTQPPPGGTQTIEAALGTLFRAIAKKNGVRYSVEVKPV